MFRIIAALFFIVLCITFYFRRKKKTNDDTVSSDPVSIHEVSPFIMIALRMAGASLWVSLILYLINPNWMAWSQLPLPDGIRWIGVGIAAISIPLMVWFFMSIGTNITQTVGIKQDHQLVTHGIYRRIRHPLYTIATVFFMGIALMAANWFMVVAMAVTFCFLLLRLSQEEAKLIEHFGVTYEAYMERTGRFLPRL